MTVLRKREVGVALVLTLWIIAAISVLAGGLISISRDEIELVGDRVERVRAFHLGKGVAQLAMQEWLHLASSGDDLGGRLDARGSTFSYRIDDIDVFAKILPANGFVSLTGSSKETWQALLTGLGKMSASDAGRASESLSGMSAIGSPSASFQVAGRSSFQQFQPSTRGGGRSTAYVESLLGIEGLTRDVYERIRRSVSPFSSSDVPIGRYAPDELKPVFFKGTSDEPAVGIGSVGYFCVEVSMTFPSTNRLSQRIWLFSPGGGSDKVTIARLERPVFLSDGVAKVLL